MRDSRLPREMSYIHVPARVIPPFMLPSAAPALQEPHNPILFIPKSTTRNLRFLSSCFFDLFSVEFRHLLEETKDAKYSLEEYKLHSISSIPEWPIPDPGRALR